MFELNGSYSDVQKTKTKTANRSRFWLPEIGTLEETIEERCLVVFLETRVIGDWWDSPQSVHSNKMKTGRY